MIKVLIVDDEPLIRRGIESMISWSEMGCRLVGQAQNGEEGLRKIEEEAPDIVFTDIKMPKMDGISMMKEAIKEDCPPVFVVLSSYDDFELVRAAMKLGAIDYLIKLNIEENELRAVLQEAMKRLKEKEHCQPHEEEKPVFKQNFIKEMLKFHPDKEMCEKILPPFFALQQGHFYQVLYIEAATNVFAENDLAQNFLLNICKEQIPANIETYGCIVSDKSAAFYLESEENPRISRENFVVKCKAMICGIKLYLNQSCSIGISSEHRNMMHLSEALNEAMQSVCYSVDNSDCPVYYYGDFLSVEYLNNYIERLSQESDFFDEVSNFLLLLKKFLAKKGAWEETCTLAYSLIEKIYSLDSNSKNYLDKEYTCLEDIKKSAPNISALEEWLEHLEECLSQHSWLCDGQIFRYKVKKAQNYIYNNRFSKISLNEVAEKLEITPSYLSRIFKKVIQKSFSDYVAEVKINEAKKLLLENNNRIYEVSEMLGYDDPYYFSKVFKKITQMTPSEYIGKN